MRGIILSIADMLVGSILRSDGDLPLNRSSYINSIAFVNNLDSLANMRERIILGLVGKLKALRVNLKGRLMEKFVVSLDKRIVRRKVSEISKGI
jgi:hypothetical protein